MNSSTRALFKLFGFMSGTKETAASRRISKSRHSKNHTPPRSMTPQEREYYDKYKHLNGFYQS